MLLSFSCFGIEIMDYPAQYAAALLSRSDKFIATAQLLIPLFIPLIDSSLVLEKKM